ncbi:hypothetical protein Acr_00g0089240 [Actinidia rufa]|uniref:Uncharacterized protein n=1 Tax=Actinidia rufa TaxID=165716 RepID=A0A7J0DYF6_9ERIC|nr:hypothetical protein Acr_00g0089240 [Actinidia rufa]
MGVQIGIWWRSIKPSILPRSLARRRQHFGSGRSDEYFEGGYGELNGDDLARSHGLVLPRSRGFGDKQPLKRSWATSFVMVLGATCLPWSPKNVSHINHHCHITTVKPPPLFW